MSHLEIGSGPLSPLLEKVLNGKGSSGGVAVKAQREPLAPPQLREKVESLAERYTKRKAREIASDLKFAKEMHSSSSNLFKILYGNVEEQYLEVVASHERTSRERNYTGRVLEYYP